MFEVVDPYLDGEGHSVVWIPSTAHYCLDRLECHIVDFVTKKEGNTLFIIEDVNGENDTKVRVCMQLLASQG